MKDAAVHVEFADRPLVPNSWFAIPQQKLSSMHVAAHGNVEATVTNHTEGIRLMHQRDARSIRARESLVSVRLSLIPVIESAYPYVIVRSWQADVAIYEHRDSGVGQAIHDVLVVTEQVVIAQDRVLPQRRLDVSQAIDHGFDVSRVKRNEVTAKEKQIRVRVAERRENVLQQPRMKRGSSVEVGGERDAKRRCARLATANSEDMLGDFERAL
jgi:hypothetical protein